MQKETYVNSFPRRASSTASYASSSVRRASVAVEQPPPPQQPHFAHHVTAPEPLTSDDYFDYDRYVPTDALACVPVEGGDRELLDHFLSDVQRLIFPILDLHGTARHDVVVPALVDNESYRHCCLSIAALHLKTTQRLTGVNADLVDQDITRHRFKTISGLCEALNRDTDHLKILEATLGMILFQVSSFPPPPPRLPVGG